MTVTKGPLCSTYPDSDRAALSRLLDGDGVGSTQVGTPVTTTDGDDAQLGDDDGGPDGGGHLLGGLDAEADVTLRVTDDDDGLEAGTLTGTGLLLDGLDLEGWDDGSVSGWVLSLLLSGCESSARCLSRGWFLPS